MSMARALISQDAIRAILAAYLTPLPDGIESKVQKYIELIEKWGEKIPLTSVRDPVEMLRFHFGESIFALSLGEISRGRLADVGSGAGFPGIALKLARPGLPVTLIEPNRKKCAFLHEVIRTLALEDVQVASSGYESSGIDAGSVDTVVSRALGEQGKILRWAKRILMRDGSVLLWVGKGECERVVKNKDWHWEEPALIQGTKARFILRGSPVK